MDYELLTNGKVQILGRAPEFTTNSTRGKVTLSFLENNNWHVLFSYKEDFYSIATAEMILFQNNIQNFQKMNTEVIAISTGNLLSHQAWVNEIYRLYGVEITFPIIEDPIGEIARKYGMVSKEANNCVTSNVVIVDNTGIVRCVFEYPTEIERNVYEILRVLKCLIR